MSKRYLLLIMVLVFSGCSLFESGKSRKGSGYAPVGLTDPTGAIVIDDTVSGEVSTEIYDAIISSFDSVAVNGEYKYGKKTQAKTFARDSVKVLISSCTSGSQCMVDLFISKTDPNLRPIFVIPTDNEISSCPINRRAYIRNITMLASDAIGPKTPYSMNDVNSPVTVCSNISDPARVDYLCRKKNEISSVAKQSSVTVNYSSGNIFDVVLPVPDYVLNIKYDQNLASNMICLDKIFRPSLWGVTRWGAAPVSTRKDIGVFKVTLKMVQ